MADAAAFPWIPQPPALPEPNPPLARKHWEVEYSRFFNFPQVHSATVDTALRPLSNATLRYGGGTWLTASSPSIIRIVKDASHALAVLTVSVSDYVHEEHIALSLQLSWPQIACSLQCPMRGSRVVLMSYRDCSSQIQKFAVRFSSSEVVESFISFFKGCLMDTINIEPSTCDFMCDSSSPSEMIASDALQYNFEDGESYKEADDQDESHCPIPILVSGINNTTFSGIPLSFTELLSNSSKILNKEISTQLEEANHAHESGEEASNQSLPNVELEEDLKNEITRYLSDASFLDMLFKIEKVIHEHGGL